MINSSKDQNQKKWRNRKLAKIEKFLGRSYDKISKDTGKKKKKQVKSFR